MVSDTFVYWSSLSLELSMVSPIKEDHDRGHDTPLSTLDQRLQSLEKQLNIELKVDFSS